MAVVSTHTSLNTEPLTLLGQHLHLVAQETLYPELKMYQFGQRVPLPPNRGKVIYIPYFKKIEPIEAMGTGASEVCAPANAFGISAHRYTGTLQGYHGYFRFTDFFWDTHEVPGVLAAGTRQLAAHMAKTYDNLIVNGLSAKGTAINGRYGHACAASTSTLTTRLTLRGMFAAEETLESKDNMAFPDGFWPAIFAPRQIYHLFTNAAGVAATEVNLTQWLQTQKGQIKFEMAEVGTIGRLKVMTSTSSVKKYAGATNTAAIGGSGYAANCLYNAFVIAPGAYAVVDMEGNPPSIIIQPFGSGGATGDPTKKVMSIGMKAYFTAIPMDTTNRLVRILSAP